MPEDEDKPRSIRFPRSVWEALDDDAQRCKRSSSKQLEAILAVYYGLNDVELKDVNFVRDIVSPQISSGMLMSMGRPDTKLNDTPEARRAVNKARIMARSEKRKS